MTGLGMKVKGIIVVAASPLFTLPCFIEEAQPARL